MSTIATSHLEPLEKKLRGKLEDTVKEARDVAEDAARAACKQLGVGQAKPDSHLSEDERDLRRRLRIHGRQLGDKREPNSELQEVALLVEEIAYEHWHRMLFARFLAENQLLMYPDPDEPVAVSLEDCEDLASDEGAANGWELAARFATKMLPQIFRVDSPVYSLTLPPEKQQRLEQILSDLPTKVFTASDSLGWVYQFWQAKRKDEVNASEVKIGARELPAVTQLFTEPYMVSFLLDNSLGAWWAARRLTENDLQNVESELELREKASLPGVPLEYLRFVRDEETGCWTPAAGTFNSWPESLSELKTLDPCCGSGHFLVAALLMLAPMRMYLEGLAAQEAVDRVLSENLHGLEIDQRCVELAAFALALAAWRFPDAGGYRILPDLNVACCGLSVSVAKEEWKSLAKDNTQLKIALDWMYDEFKYAPVLGSLLNPAKSMAAKVVTWTELIETLQHALRSEDSEIQKEATITASGLSVAADLLSQKYNLVLTNVPYLSRGKQSDRLKSYCDVSFPQSKGDLATSFLDRCIESIVDGGAFCGVIPQNWLFQQMYKAFRTRLLKTETWNFVAKLGAQAFRTPMWDFNVQLFMLSSGLHNDLDISRVCGIDASSTREAESKSRLLVECKVETTCQSQQLENPDSRIIFGAESDLEPLAKTADGFKGLSTGDINRYVILFWELESPKEEWEFYQGAVGESCSYSGRSQLLRWETGAGSMVQAPTCYVKGTKAWNKRGVSVNQMNRLPATIYNGNMFDENAATIIPNVEATLAAVFAFCSSPGFGDLVRDIDQALKVTNKTLVKVPFDLTHWQQVASEKYPHGLPEPYSDDPTQWLFHGHPASSSDPLQVAVSRLLDYRWPTELDQEMELATDARAWVERSSELIDSADGDGIVCLPGVGSELPAEDRLLNLLHKAYEQGREQEQVFREKLEAADENDPLTIDLWRCGWKPSLPGSFNEWLDSLLAAVDHKDKPLHSWLRDKFFAQHCKLFHNRPFIWHIWDGLKDGFSVLVNYHKLENKLLETLIYNYLGSWIKTQKNQVGKVDGSEERLDAANALKVKLELILKGEAPHDIFVRWKPLDEQPIGWNPDLNDGVRINIRPWMTVGDVGKRGAGVLRDKPNCKWSKDRGKDIESAPWYHLGPKYGGKEGDRINDHHLTLEEKKQARQEAK